jgi:hypothetical protein
VPPPTAAQSSAPQLQATAPYFVPPVKTGPPSVRPEQARRASSQSAPSSHPPVQAPLSVPARSAAQPRHSAWVDPSVAVMAPAAVADNN